MFHLIEGEDRLEKQDKNAQRTEMFSLRSPLENWSQFHSRALQLECRNSQISRMLQMLLEKEKERDLQAQAEGWEPPRDGD